MYRDIIGQCTFERLKGEAILDAEHYEVACAGCSILVMGTVKHRSLFDIAKRHKGWLVFVKGKTSLLYCSMICAAKHDTQGVWEFMQNLNKQRLRLENYHGLWQDAFAAATDSEGTASRTPA